MRTALPVLVALLLTGCLAKKTAQGPILREGTSNIVVRSSAAFPEEIEDPVQASMVACQGATAEGQAVLLTHVLKKRAASGKPLSEAEVPHIEVQRHIRTIIKDAEVLETSVKNKTCTITIGIPKSQVRAVLKEAK